MGFFDRFTSGSSIFNQNSRWYEPWMWEARQDGTFYRKMITAAIFPVVGAVVFLIIFSVVMNYNNLPALVHAFMGMLFGLLFSAFYLGKELGPSSVKVGKKEIVRAKYSFAGSMQWIHWERWPYSAIRQCRIIPKNPSGKGYTIIEITTHDGQCDRIAICDLVDLTKVGQLIQSHGVSVLVPGGVLPPGPKGNPALRMVAIRMAIGVPLVLVLLFFATNGFRDKKQDRNDDNPRAAQAGAGRIGLSEEQIRASTRRAGGSERSIRDQYFDNHRPSPSARPDDDTRPSQRLRPGDELPIGGVGPRGSSPSGLRPRSAPRHVPGNIKPPKYETQIPETKPEGPLVDPFAD